MEYNKLVRDKIPEIIRKNGKRPITRIASEKEFRKKLVEKLKEETNEFFEEQNAEELADILEVIYAICDLNKISRKKLELIRKTKKADRGGFKKRIVLKRTV